MISASGLARNCRHDKDVLDKVAPRNAAERTREANKKASAERGTEFHGIVEAWVKSGTTVPSFTTTDAELAGWVDLLAFQWRPPQGFESEVRWGLTPDGNYTEVVEIEPHVYQAKDGSKLLTAGTADGVWVSGETLYEVDWKSGKWPVDPARINLQANAGGMALALRSFCKRYEPGIYYTRDAAWDWGEPVEVASKEWRAMFEEIRAAALLDEKPRPGPHCAKCWSRSKCPASEAP